ncbi:MAG TPA: hypothetical protein VHF91_02510 [Acidimicrobiales bacterium]|nr:hypothetical protein [Acidimicrobiales bacterium]
MRRLLTAILPILLLVVLAGPASAQTPVLDRAAQELRRSPVYVDPAAERAGQVSAERLRERVGRGDGSLFVAVLPAAAASEAGGSVQQSLTTLMGKVGLRGTYAVLIGDSFLATSSAIPAGQAATLANRAIQSHRSDGPGAVLENFVDRVNQAETGSGASQGDGGTASDGRDSGDGGGGGGGGALLLLLAIGAGGFFLWSRSRRSRERQADKKEFQADRQLLQAELSVLGSDVMELEPHVTMHPEARPDYDAGVTRYRSAQAALSTPTTRSTWSGWSGSSTRAGTPWTGLGPVSRAESLRRRPRS